MDALGDRMKMYESAEAGKCLMPLLPIVARIDGRSFSSFTRGLERPYCPSMHSCMVETTRHLVSETGANIGYTQSDEITLIWQVRDYRSQLWFNGRIHKMVSQLAAQATLAFYIQVKEKLPGEYAEKLPTFDARVWNVPTQTEAANALLWREMDATKNSISMAASTYYSHKELMGKSGAEKQDMLVEKFVNWNNFPAEFKRGSYLQRKTEVRRLTEDEKMNLPRKHAAFTDPFLLVERSAIKKIDMPIFSTVTNRENVIFLGEDPITREETPRDDHAWISR